MKPYALGLALAAVLSTAVQAAPDYQALVLGVADGQIIPAAQQFRDKGGALRHAAQSFCAAPSPAGLEAVKAGFHETMDAWQAVQPSPFGPVDAFNRGQRVHFWPDKKSSGDRQMAQLLKERNADSLDPTRMAFASVAVQGLPALELLVFGEGNADKLLAGGEDAAFRCRLATAIAVNLATMGAEIAGDWTKAEGFRSTLANAGQPTSPYTDHKQAAAQMFNAMHTQLEAVAEVKLARPLGTSPEDARALRAESWRSQRSLDNILRNLEAVKAMAEAGLLPALAADGKPAAGQKLMAAFDDALAAGRSLGMPLEQAVTEPAGWKKLAALKAKTKEAGRILGTEVGPAIGLQLGFNGLDGD